MIRNYSVQKILVILTSCEICLQCHNEILPLISFLIFLYILFLMVHVHCSPWYHLRIPGSGLGARAKAKAIGQLLGRHWRTGSIDDVVVMP